MSTDLPLRTEGIYHNLPSFPRTLINQTAIITGANGISGFGTLRALLDTPHRWSKVYLLSRSATDSSMLSLLTSHQRTLIQHVSVDFTSPPQAIASALTTADLTHADYIFFYSYLQPAPPPGSPPWSNVDELVRVNTALLQNFLGALPIVGIKPKRFLLQTGAKNYGVHLGRTRTPAVESDPQPSHIEPNFYYPQEAALFSYCATHDVGWNIIMPAWIIGATTAAAMNALYPFAVYAAVQARRNKPLKYFGDFDAWQALGWHSCARLTGYLSEWAVLTDGAKNQRFNSIDGGPFSWDRFYQQLAEKFGVDQGVELPRAVEDGGQYMEIKGDPKRNPLGYGPGTLMRVSGGFVQWAKEEGNREAWKEIMKESEDGNGGKIVFDPFEDVEKHFTFGDAAGLGMYLARNKANLMGWTGFCDTHEGVWEMYREMTPTGLGMLPKFKEEIEVALA